VTELHTRRVERDSTGFFDGMLDLAGRNEQEIGVVIHKTGDEPRTGNAIDMDMRTGNPEHGILLVKMDVKSL
jgi:hypothetical protein